MDNETQRNNTTLNSANGSDGILNNNDQPQENGNVNSTTGGLDPADVQITVDNTEEPKERDSVVHNEDIEKPKTVPSPVVGEHHEANNANKGDASITTTITTNISNDPDNSNVKHDDTSVGTSSSSDILPASNNNTNKDVQDTTANNGSPISILRHSQVIPYGNLGIADNSEERDDSEEVRIKILFIGFCHC